ncbi:MAG: hypothetical protein KME29_04925 [Calothrix sp. FI2-JRJ7]|jgi:hypothetical protein|nr:hypothetical protein [Calothrix sp. FI2-JRJ7]
MKPKQANKIIRQCIEKLTKVQDGIEVNFPEELAPRTTDEKFFSQLAEALGQLENCEYDLDQLEEAP